jgi:hypothetical protein
MVIIWSRGGCVFDVEHGGVRGWDLRGGRGYLPPSIRWICGGIDACSAGVVAGHTCPTATLTALSGRRPSNTARRQHPAAAERSARHLSRHAHERPQPAPKRAAAHRSGTGRLISHERVDHFALRADTEDGRSVSLATRLVNWWRERVSQS